MPDRKNHGTIRILTRLIRIDLVHLFRRISNPILLVLLVLLILSFSLTLGTFHHLASMSASFHGISNPKFGLGAYEPLLFYLCMVVSLVFALRLNSYRETSIQNVVITYRSPSNFHLALSRVLTPTLLVAGVLIGTAVVYQVVATVNVAIQPGIVEPFESQSIIFVLVNLFVALFFWSSLGVLTSQIFKSSTVGFFLTLLMLVGQASLSRFLPDDLGSLTFGYAATNLYVSELAPDYWDVERFIYLTSFLCISFAFIYATSAIHDRTDPRKQSTYKLMAISFGSICLVCQTLVITLSTLTLSQHQSWVQAYEEAILFSDHTASVKAISGKMEIVGGSKLSLDLDYLVELDDVSHVDSVKNGSAILLFALNPGMKIEQMRCSNSDLAYSYRNGILEVDLSSCERNSNDEYSFTLVASGMPIPHYLVKHIPQNGYWNADPQFVRIMGQRSSIFTSDYVALTPLSHWYPRLLSSNSLSSDQTTSNLTNISLMLDVEPTSWILVSSDGQILKPQNSQDDLVLLSGHYESLGLLASKFHVSTHSFETADVNVLVHSRHAKRLRRNEILVDGLVRYISDTISKLQSHGIDFPQNQFSIVEVPATLSLLNIDGGVDVGMESILMFRESGLPFARTARLYDMIEGSKADGHGYLADQVESFVSNYWTNPIFNRTYEDAIVESLLVGRINHADEHARLTETLMQTLLFNLMDSWNYRFDYNLAKLIAPQSRVAIPYMWQQRKRVSRHDLRMFQQAFLNSNAFWESIENSFLFNGSSSDQVDFGALQGHMRRERFRVLKLSELIADSYNEQTIGTTLTNIMQTKVARTIDFDLIESEAMTSNMIIASLIQNTLLNVKLPGINFSVARQLEFEEPNEQGERFNTVLNLRNNEHAVGYVTFHVVETGESEVVDGMELEVVASSTKLGPFELQGNSSYSFVVNTKNLIGQLEANTFLSLNRGEVLISIENVPTKGQISENDNLLESYSLVASDWNSKINENELIVDDLDLGFKVPQTNYRKKSNFWSFGTDWFRSLFPRQVGLDNGLPIERNQSGPWARSSRFACWGRYRHTIAIGDSSKPGEHRVAFEAELPKTGKWSLSYHFPDASYILGAQGSTAHYDIDVSVGDQNWNLTYNQDNWIVGWNELSHFEIASPGTARVAVSNVSDAAYVFADAIKWKYLD